MGMGFAQEKFLQVALAEPQNQSKAGQDDKGQGHDPGHPVVLLVDVAVAMGRMAVAMLLRHRYHMATDGWLP